VRGSGGDGPQGGGGGMSAPVSVPMERGRATKTSPYGVRACAVVRCPIEGIAELRQKLGPPGGEPFPATVLKPAGGQTVVAVAAVLQAVARLDLDEVCFADWGVIAAPRFLGRVAAADTIHKFETGGAWKASPLFVPHRSLHAVSGTISQALQCKGPNF